MRARILCLLALCLAAEGFAAKKDFKGLFGSYRREKFTENEGRLTDVGFDLMLSTLMPVTNVVSSAATPASTPEAMYYASFFNLEGSFFITFNYHWEAYLSIGVYSYSTRFLKDIVANSPRFQLFDMTLYPVLGGVKYRFSTSDIVPYLGAGIGAVYANRRTTYDYVAQTYDDNYLVSWAAQATAGVEFFIAPRTGIRLEASAMMLGLPSRTFDPTGSQPLAIYSANPIAVRYASGLFVLF